MIRKRAVILAIQLLALSYYLTPIYLFVSQQFEVARSVQ